MPDTVVYKNWILDLRLNAKSPTNLSCALGLFTNALSLYTPSSEHYCIIQIVAQMIELLLTEGKSDGELTSMRISLEKISQFAHATEKPRQMLADYTSLVAIEESVIGTNSLCHPDRVFLVSFENLIALTTKK